MKFENVSKLVSQMDNIFTAQGYVADSRQSCALHCSRYFLSLHSDRYGEVKDGAPVKKQQGTFRTKCVRTFLPSEPLSISR